MKTKIQKEVLYRGRIQEKCDLKFKPLYTAKYYNKNKNMFFGLASYKKEELIKEITVEYKRVK